MCSLPLYYYMSTGVKLLNVLSQMKLILTAVQIITIPFLDSVGGRVEGLPGKGMFVCSLNEVLSTLLYFCKTQKVGPTTSTPKYVRWSQEQVM